MADDVADELRKGTDTLYDDDAGPLEEATKAVLYDAEISLKVARKRDEAQRSKANMQLLMGLVLGYLVSRK